MKVDYLIVGQGLAGSLVAAELLQRNKKVLVLDNPNMNISSSVAAGLFNPVTGRRFVKTWKADVIFPFLLKYYSQLEKILGARFLFRLPLFRPFLNTEEQNDVLARNTTGDLKDYIDRIVSEKSYLRISNPYGGVILKKTGYLDIHNFIHSMRQFLHKHDAYREVTYSEEKLYQSDQVFYYDNIKAGKVIYCNGLEASQSKFFKLLPFKPVKGELIHITISPPFEFIFNRNIFILPIKNGIHKVGATYTWDYKDISPSMFAKNYLEDKLNGVLNVNFKTIDHMAGIRPATKDRRPFVGSHPEINHLGILNGLGSKGVSLGPFFAQKIANHMEKGIEIEYEANIKRYI